jgi:hypothetical protein
VGAELARDGGLTADLSLADVRRSIVGAGLPAMAACMRKLLTILNAMLRDQKPFELKSA